jgi:hypothetical protein
MLCFERNYVVTGSELYSAIPGRGLTGNEKGQNTRHGKGMWTFHYSFLILKH